MAYSIIQKKKNEKTKNPNIKNSTAKSKEAAERAAWLKKTRRSPAATATTKGGKKVWSDNERWEQQKRHRAWKESRKKGTSKTTSKSQPKTDPVTKKKTNKYTEVTKKDTKLTTAMKRGGIVGFVNRKRKRLGDKLKVASSAFKKG